MALSNKARKVVEGKERTAIDTLKRLVDAPLSALATDAELDALAAPLITTLHEYVHKNTQSVFLNIVTKNCLVTG
jgi:hypothetical protein